MNWFAKFSAATCLTATLLAPVVASAVPLSVYDAASSNPQTNS